jgi:hypothetical protein
MSAVLSIAAVVGDHDRVAAAAPPGACPGGSEWVGASLLNTYRAANGRSSLRLSAELTSKAQAWSERMAASGQLSHSTLSAGVSSGWEALAENVAQNYSVQAAQVALQNSPGHRTNMLGSYTEMGVGVAEGSGGTIWVTQVFARRSTPTAGYQLPAGSSAYGPVAPYAAINAAKVGAGSTTRAKVAGVGGVPSTARSAVVTIEARGTTSSGFVQALGLGAAAGSASSLNLFGADAANTAVVPIASDGTIALYASTPLTLSATVTGYFAPVTGAVAAGRLQQMTPARVLDTSTRIGYGGARPTKGQAVTVKVTGKAGVPSSGVGGVIVNLTVVRADSAARVSVSAPGLSTGGWRTVQRTKRGGTLSSLVVLPLSSLGQITVMADTGAHLVIDVQGWFTNSGASKSVVGLFVPVPATRVLDTRKAIGISTRTRVTGALAVALPGRGNLPKCATAVLGNQAIIPVTATYGQAGPLSEFSPGAFASVTADTANRATANAFLSTTGAYASIGLYTPASSHLVTDITGWFL